MRVVLDTSVLLEYFRGKPALRDLFSPRMRQRVQFAVNPVVLQELLFVGGAVGDNMDLGELEDTVEVIPSDIFSSPQAMARLRSFRNHAVHANDLVILGSTAKGDILLTYDPALTSIGEWSGVRITTPETFLAEQAAA
jgi:predicted nucleic acid-binding protein